MFKGGCARGVVLLLLASSSFSRSMDDTPRTLDATVDWNSASEEAFEQGSSIEDEQRIDEEDLEGVNATGDVKESRYGYGGRPPYGPCPPYYGLQGVSTPTAPITFNNTVVCQQLAINAGITSSATLQTYLQQCAGLLNLVSAQTTSPPTTPPVTSICQVLATNAGITVPAALQAYLQQCTSLLGFGTVPITTAPTNTAAPTITPPVASICQVLATNAGITAPAALQAYLQQCASLLGLITPQPTTAPTTTAPTNTAAPTLTPPVASVCQVLATNAGITAPAALQVYLLQCASLLGTISG